MSSLLRTVETRPWRKVVRFMHAKLLASPADGLHVRSSALNSELSQRIKPVQDDLEDLTKVVTKQGLSRLQADAKSSTSEVGIELQGIRRSIETLQHQKTNQWSEIQREIANIQQESHQLLDMKQSVARLQHHSHQLSDLKQDIADLQDRSHEVSELQQNVGRLERQYHQWPELRQDIARLQQQTHQWSELRNDVSCLQQQQMSPNTLETGVRALIEHVVGPLLKRVQDHNCYLEQLHPQVASTQQQIPYYQQQLQQLTTT
ncbi:MAG: hypothetical protein J3Q66DRAFT_370990 [Benniella sp.]|nr:MAG: hypothetical protein J3Q66DRAFT_370990 [Benniella sp.]